MQEPAFATTTLTTTICTDIASSTDGTECFSTTTPQVTYYDWIMMNGFILFLLASMCYGIWFSEFKDGKKIK
jgi:hypothetical protein